MHCHRWLHPFIQMQLQTNLQKSLIQTGFFRIHQCNLGKHLLGGFPGYAVLREG